MIKNMPTATTPASDRVSSAGWSHEQDRYFQYALNMGVGMGREAEREEYQRKAVSTFHANLKKVQEISESQITRLSELQIQVKAAFLRPHGVRVWDAFIIVDEEAYDSDVMIQALEFGNKAQVKAGEEGTELILNLVHFPDSVDLDSVWQDGCLLRWNSEAA